MTHRRYRTTTAERARAFQSESRSLMESVTFVQVPPISRAEELAEQLRQNFTSDASGLVVAESIVELNGWDLTYRRMHYEASKSEINALLIPSETKRQFSLVVDSDCLQGDDADEVAAGLVGHEVGHVFFFNRALRGTRAPRPTMPLHYLPSEEEREKGAKIERFCDHFSLHLTGFDLEVYSEAQRALRKQQRGW